MDSETLSQLHSALERLLGEFQRVCDLLELPYVVYGGTAIGAIRHQGFIPWDDDVDVCMLRSDYERFLLEAPSLIGPEYTLENSRTNPDYPNMFTKLSLRGTVFVPAFIEKSPYKPMVALDVFPVDEVSPTEEGYKKQLRSAWLWGRMLYIQGTPKPVVPLDGFKKRLAHLATGAGYWGMRLFRVKPAALQKKWERAARRYEGSGSSLYADFSDVNPKAWEVSVSELYPAQEAPFESLTVKIPAEYDRVLRRGYGDYMEMPPKEDRKTHVPVELSLAGYGRLS